MLPSNKPTTLDEMDQLLEIWKILEVLTVSLDRIGMNAALTRVGQGQSALDIFIDPSLFQRIATARTLAYQLLVTRDPDMREKLERLSDDEDAMGYWQSA